MIDQLALDLDDTDARERGRRLVASRLRREAQLEKAIRRRALRIRHQELPQDIRILCPVSADGAWCQWVAGHYGACVLGRQHSQRVL